MRWVAAAVEKDGSLDLLFFFKVQSPATGISPRKKRKKKGKKVLHYLTVDETDKTNICTTTD